METCEYCKRVGERQTADDLTKGLVWLWPEEFWCCEICLETRRRQVIIGVAT